MGAHNRIDLREGFPLGRGFATICGIIRIRARWRSGYAPDCKSVYPGSIPGRASIDGFEKSNFTKTVDLDVLGEVGRKAGLVSLSDDLLIRQCTQSLLLEPIAPLRITRQ